MVTNLTKTKKFYNHNNKPSILFVVTKRKKTETREASTTIAETVMADAVLEAVTAGADLEAVTADAGLETVMAGLEAPEMTATARQIDSDLQSATKSPAGLALGHPAAFLTTEMTATDLARGVCLKTRRDSSPTQLKGTGATSTLGPAVTPRNNTDLVVRKELKKEKKKKFKCFLLSSSKVLAMSTLTLHVSCSKFDLSSASNERRFEKGWRISTVKVSLLFTTQRRRREEKVEKK